MLPRVTLLLVALALLPLGSFADDKASPYRGTLIEHRIPPTREGISQHLLRLHPSEERIEVARKLIGQLGDEQSFSVRQTAMKQLIAMPHVPMQQLSAATDSNDPEVRWRAKLVIGAVTGGDRDRLMYAVFKTIEQEQIDGLADEILRAVPLVGEGYLRQAATAALLATVDAEDAKVLRQSLKVESIDQRVAACLALEKAIGKAAADDLYSLLEDEQPAMRLAAAQALANHGNLRCLPALVELLEDDSPEIRAKANAVLRASTGERFGFVAYGRADQREAKVQQWQDWLKLHGRSAKLKFPLKALARAEIGHTIVTAYSQGRAYVIDEKGKEIVKLAGDIQSGPWGCQYLDNGNYLINYYGGAGVVEYDPEGKVVWSYRPGNLSAPWSSQRLPNGNTLIAHGGKLREVDPKGKTVSEKQYEANLCQALQLENGNLLVATTASPGRVIEYDPGGKEIMEIKGTQTAYRLQRLDNGNTLVTEKGAGRVREFDPSGKVVWEHAIPSPDGAQRIANGNTIIGNGSGLHEVSPDGKVVWQHQTSGQTLFWRF